MHTFEIYYKIGSKHDSIRVSEETEEKATKEIDRKWNELVEKAKRFKTTLQYNGGNRLTAFDWSPSNPTVELEKV